MFEHGPVIVNLYNSHDVDQARVRFYQFDFSNFHKTNDFLSKSKVIKISGAQDDKD